MGPTLLTEVNVGGGIERAERNVPGPLAEEQIQILLALPAIQSGPNKRETAVIKRYSHALIFRWHFWWHLDCQILAECDDRGQTGLVHLIEMA
jgi:hypothetical protein